GVIIAGTSYRHLIKTYNKYSKIESFENYTAFDFCALVINKYNLNTKLALTEGKLTDAYLIKKDTIVLSEDVAMGKSVADISVACHEVGHALQKKQKSSLLAFQLFLGFFNRIANSLFPLVFLTALVFVFIPSVSGYAPILFYVGVGMWLLTVLFRIVLIPVEVDASKRAYKILKDFNIFEKEELKMAKKVLTAAGMTYVGGLFINLYKLLFGIKKSFRRY
ncbi:MAG: zinc metallopeptidase, partial [Clostridiales bacterium]|nr:zinc metallopeptidase [Candidatus Apopatousia equi]